MTSLDTQKAVDAPIINAASFSIADKDALPKGFPVTITGAKVWVGDDYKNKQSHHTYLTNAEIKEITEALLYFKSKSCYPTLYCHVMPYSVTCCSIPLGLFPSTVYQLCLQIYSRRILYVY